MRRRKFLNTILAVTLAGNLLPSSFATGIPENSQECQIREMKKAFKQQVDSLEFDTRIYYVDLDNGSRRKITTIPYNDGEAIVGLAKKFKFVKLGPSDDWSMVLPVLMSK